MFCLLTKLFRIFSVIVSLCPISRTRALLRTIGPVGDPHFKKAVAACDGANPKNFEFAVCSPFVDCIYDNVTEAFKASLSSGTNIASLLPTILVLIGELGFSWIQISNNHWKQSCPFALICLTSLIARLPTPGARRTGFLITPSSNRSVLLWHRPP